MTLNEFIEDAFNTELEYLMDALGDITPEELMWRAGPEANPIGWILWHMTRVEDMWFQFFIQRGDLPSRARPDRGADTPCRRNTKEF